MSYNYDLAAGIWLDHNNFAYPGAIVLNDETTFTDDTTPDVTQLCSIKIDPTGAQTITTFENGEEYQILVVRFADALTTLDHDNNGVTDKLYLKNELDFTPSANTQMIFRKVGTYWQEITRSSA